MNIYSQDDVRALAYQIWEARGRRDGHSQDDWYEAERRLCEPHRASPESVDDSIKATFPAGDPAASHLPDEPPVNADAKWTAAGIDRAAAHRDKTLQSPLNASKNSAKARSSKSRQKPTASR